MKKILIVSPKAHEGAPVEQRILNFEKFFEDNGYMCERISSPVSFTEKMELLGLILKKRIRRVFISMPTFNNWFLIIVPFISIVFDYRDGWSIAMKNGYGNMVKRKPLKSMVSRLIEFVALVRAKYVITCTEGLISYHKKIAFGILKKKILFIPNGITGDYKIMTKKEKDKKELIFICAGKFSEYGLGNAKKVINAIHKNYPNTVNILKIVGADFDLNNWIDSYISDNNLNLSVQLLNRVSSKNLSKELQESDYGITVLRDPSYEYGTKVFDYISHRVPILNYFEEENNFTRYFAGCFNRNSSINLNKYTRRYAINSQREKLLKI